MSLIAFLENRTQQTGYLLSLADAASVAHDQIVRTDDGWEVPTAVSSAYTELAALAWATVGNGTSGPLMKYRIDDLFAPTALDYQFVGNWTSPTDSPLVTPTQQQVDDDFGPGFAPGPVPLLSAGVYLGYVLAQSHDGVDHAGRHVDFYTSYPSIDMQMPIGLSVNQTFHAWLDVSAESWLRIAAMFENSEVGRTTYFELAFRKLG